MTVLPPPATDPNEFVDRAEYAFSSFVLFEIDTFIQQADNARYYVAANDADGITFRHNIGNYDESSPVFLRLKASLETRGYSNIRAEEQFIYFTVARVPVPEETPSE